MPDEAKVETFGLTFQEHDHVGDSLDHLEEKYTYVSRRPSEHELVQWQEGGESIFSPTLKAVVFAIGRLYEEIDSQGTANALNIIDEWMREWREDANG